jgi:hypothetical protein
MFFGLFDPVIKENYWTKNGFMPMDIFMPIKIFMIFSDVETPKDNRDEKRFKTFSDKLNLCINFSHEARLDKSVQTFYELCFAELTRRYKYRNSYYQTTEGKIIPYEDPGPHNDKYSEDLVDTGGDIYIHGLSYTLNDRNLNPAILKNYLKIISNYIPKKKTKYTKVITGTEYASMMIPDIGITYVDFDAYNQLFKILNVQEKIRPLCDITSDAHADGKISGEKVSGYYTSSLKDMYYADFSHDSADIIRRDKIRNFGAYTIDSLDDVW